jgi:hypothetical protein
MAVKESPVAEVSFMAAKDSRPVREEVVDRVSVGSPGEPVVFRGRYRSREAFPVATPGEAHVSKPSGDVEFPSKRSLASDDGPQTRRPTISNASPS